MQHSYAPSGLTADQARQITPTLQDRLTGLLDMGLTLKHVHWNVVGPGFMAVHQMLDDQVDATRGMADAIAERMATLGAVPDGLPGTIVATRSWGDYSLGRAVVPAHLGALDKVYDGLIADHRNAINTIEKIDVVTADMLTAQTGELEMLQWFIRAHLQNTSGQLPTTGEPTELDAAAAAATAEHLS